MAGEEVSVADPYWFQANVATLVLLFYANALINSCKDQVRMVSSPVPDRGIKQIHYPVASICCRPIWGMHYET